MCITVCCKNFDNAVTDLDDGNIECTAAEVIYHDLLLFLVVKTVSKGCRCRLVDDTLYIKTGNLTGILCCLTLGIVEVSRNCDNCLCYLLSKVALSICF